MIIFVNPPQRKRPTKTKAQAKSTSSSVTTKPQSKTQAPSLPIRPLTSNGHVHGNADANLNGNGDAHGLIVNNGLPPPYYSSTPFLPQPTPSPYSQALLPYSPIYPHYTAPLQNPRNNDSNVASQNVTSLAVRSSEKTINSPQWTPNSINQSYEQPSINNLISTKFDALITSIDGEVFSGDEKELGITS